MIQNNLTRVLIRKPSVNASYSLIDCSGIDSLGYSQDKEFIKAQKNNRFITVGAVIDPETNWEGSITVYANSYESLPLNDLTCSYDVLILYGTCRNPADPNDFVSGIFLRDTMFGGVEQVNIKPFTSSDLNVISMDYTFISGNGSFLTTTTQIKSTLLHFDTGVFYKKCPTCEIEYVLFGENKVYLSNGNNDDFTLNASPIAIRVNDDIYIASTGEYVITDINLTKEIRFDSALVGNFTSFVLHKNKIYFTTDSGEFGYLDIESFSETIIYTGTDYKQVVIVNDVPIAVGDGIYVDGLVRNGYRVDSALEFNDSIIFTTDTNIMVTKDRFRTTEPIGTIPEAFTKIVNDEGIFYALGQSGNVYTSFGRGLNWSKPKAENISFITSHFALGDGLYTL